MRCKRSAPGREIAGAANLRLVGAYRVSSFPQCRHDRKVLKREAPGSQHYGREVCEDCGAFLRWVAKPESVEARNLRAARIARLAMIEKLTEWERGFIKSVACARKLSPKQIAIIDRLAADYLEGGA